MPLTRSRYDGYAEWYDSWNKPNAERNAPDILAPGGRLAFYGTHPCFNGPHTQWMADGGILAHPTYRLAGWHQEAPWWGPYVRKRVGMRHHPLAELLNAFISTGLVIEHVAEPGNRPVPVILAIRARKPGGSRIARTHPSAAQRFSRPGSPGTSRRHVPCSGSYSSRSNRSMSSPSRMSEYGLAPLPRTWPWLCTSWGGTSVATSPRRRARSSARLSSARPFSCRTACHR